MTEEPNEFHRILSELEQAAEPAPTSQKPETKLVKPNLPDWGRAPWEE
jgi:hypothetical protein